MTTRTDDALNWNMSVTKTVLPAMHLMVDALCACCLCLLSVRYGGAYNILELYILYNVAAFLTQPLTGYVADRCSMERYAPSFCIMLTLVVTALAWFGIGSMTPDGNGMVMWVTVTVLGLGNSAFHVWAGRLTTLHTHNDIRWLGVFVSTGAVGLSIGTLLSSWALAWLLVIGITGFTYLYLYGEKGNTQAESRKGETLYCLLKKQCQTDEYTSVDASIALVCIMVLALMALVALRSMVGGSFNASLPDDRGMILLAGVVTMAGKISGGWIARYVGLTRTLVLAVMVVALCTLFTDSGVTIVLTGLFAVNCTMPLTLYMINVVMRGREALAFGLLAASLMPAYLATII